MQQRTTVRSPAMSRVRGAAYGAPRYVTQFVNGTWQVFDTVYYSAVDAKPTAKAAALRADELNARPRPARKGPRK